jgi:Holliday junction resolvase RusA-like endonuclease
MLVTLVIPPGVSYTLDRLGQSEVVIEVPGEPRGWGRTGVRLATTKGGRVFPVHYTDKKTRIEQSVLRIAAQQAMAGRPPLDGPLVCRVTAVYLPPASWSKKKKAQAIGGLIRQSVAPDADNILKLLNDSFNKLVWVDDARVCEQTITKWYGPSPFLRAEIWKWSSATLI